MLSIRYMSHWFFQVPRIMRRNLLWEGLTLPERVLCSEFLQFEKWLQHEQGLIRKEVWRSGVLSGSGMHSCMFQLALQSQKGLCNLNSFKPIPLPRCHMLSELAMPIVELHSWNLPSYWTERRSFWRHHRSNRSILGDSVRWSHIRINQDKAAKRSYEIREGHKRNVKWG
jgi:hypothetical protein